LQRIPEPELMNDAAQALAYAQADFSEPHARFVELFDEKFSGRMVRGTVLDLGCGPADISRRFARAHPECRLHGIDGARQMLELGHLANTRSGLNDRIELFEVCLPSDTLPLTQYTALISNSLLHHLHDPLVLWRTVLDFIAPGSPLFLMDLFRPPSVQAARAIVEQYAYAEPAVLREDFYASLCAAFTPGEIREQLAVVGLAGLTIETVSNRHVIVYGDMP